MRLEADIPPRAEGGAREGGTGSGEGGKFPGVDRVVVARQATIRSRVHQVSWIEEELVFFVRDSGSR